jgi:hypothetical protein
VRFAIGILLLVGAAHGDAFVVSRAMNATTIAEIFIDKSGVRVELEIGVADSKAFQNLLPDELYRALVLPPEPQADRLKKFFGADFVLRADGKVLDGELRLIEARLRVLRDEVTGEPLGDSKEVALVATLFYAFPATRSATPTAVLTIRPPVGANIGFVAYHDSLPINDFRYLSGEATVDLDWTDPWYSQFRHPNLKRQNNAPLRAFLYVDHFEVRQEIIVRPRDLRDWIDLEIGDTIRAQDQPEILRKVGAFLAGRNPVKVDGVQVEGVLDRIHFVRRTLRSTGVVEPGEDLSSLGATLGVIYSYPIAALPKEVTLEWTLFSDRIGTVPAVATDEAGGMPSQLTAEDPILRWQNFLKNPTRPTLLAIAPPPEASMIAPVVSIGLFTIGLLLFAFARRVPGAILATVGLLGWFLIPSAPDLPEEEGRELIASLLQNVYRAFDHREEQAIYDTLARSASGDLLQQIYLETRQSLVLEGQGGARVKVVALNLENAALQRVGDDLDVVARCTWTVAGTVGHWGHLHLRRNRYEATILIRPIDGVWKIVAIELLDEQRI